MRTAFILAITLLICGCSVNDIQPQEDQIVIHPELPRPIKGLQTSWSIIEFNNNIYIGTTYPEFLKMLEFQNDIIRYMDQMNKTVCYYRQDITDQICQQNMESTE